jgi:uncharacterized SAM-dependent methyltransferase
LFYDAHGSALFEAICRVPEYYLTRTEIAILERYAGDIAARIGPHGRLIELGSGASIKVRILLQALENPVAYVPVDISRDHLRDAAALLAADFPGLAVVAVCADYTRSFNLPPLPGPAGKRVGFFPVRRSAISNPKALSHFSNIAADCGARRRDDRRRRPQESPAILNAAYNDAAGTNAAFNLNLLGRINRELGGD